MKKLLILSAFLLFQFQSNAQNQNMAMQFDGVNDYLEIFDANSLDITDQLTISLWYFFVPGSTGEPGIVQKDGFASWGRYGIWLYDTDYPDFCLFPQGGYQECYTSDQSLIDYAWNHLALTYDGSVLFAYLNGQMLGYIENAFSISTSDMSLFVGADPTEPDYVTGKIDELSIWNVYKSQSEIQQMMYDTLPPSVYHNSENGLVVYYRFDRYEDLGVREDGPDDIRDLSTYENHGDAEGSPELVASDAPSYVSPIGNDDTYGLVVYPGLNSAVAIIQFELKSAAYTSVRIYNLLGQDVEEVCNGNLPAGLNQFELNTLSFEEGLYLCSVRVGMNTETVKLIVKK